MLYKHSDEFSINQKKHSESEFATEIDSESESAMAGGAGPSECLEA